MKFPSVLQITEKLPPFEWSNRTSDHPPRGVTRGVTEVSQASVRGAVEVSPEVSEVSPQGHPGVTTGVAGGVTEISRRPRTVSKKFRNFAVFQGGIGFFHLK